MITQFHNYPEKQDYNSHNPPLIVLNNKLMTFIMKHWPGVSVVKEC